MRLTYELGYKGSKYYDTDNKKDMPINNIWRAINKLGQLEDIEEELGIDLLILFKAVMNGFWYKNSYGYHQIDSYEYVIDLESSRLIQLYEENGKIFDFKDYGKTWALTKEELENDK